MALQLLRVTASLGASLMFSGGLAWSGTAGAQTVTVIKAFNGGSSLSLGPLLAVGSGLYGTSSGCSGDPAMGSFYCYVSLYEISPKNGKETLLTSWDFNNSLGTVSPIVDYAGVLYLTISGGNEAGAILGYNIKTKQPLLPFNFDGLQSAGATPVGTLTFLKPYLYGVTTGGGSNGGGILYRVAPMASGTVNESDVASLPFGSEGLVSSGLTVVGKSLVGADTEVTASAPGGSVYSYSPATGAFATVYGFTGTAAGGGDGAFPRGGLTVGGTMLYGTTIAGGTAAPYYCGTVYSLVPATGAETVLHSFGGSSTTDPCGSSGVTPMIYVSGNLFGIFGGEAAEISANSGSLTVLDAFAGGPEGTNVTGLAYLNGAFYGTTTAGAANGDGAFFKITP